MSNKYSNFVNSHNVNVERNICSVREEIIIAHTLKYTIYSKNVHVIFSKIYKGDGIC